MREYGKVHTSFWTSKTIRALSDDARTLAIYLLTCEHGSIIGAFRLPLAYACDDLGWVPERFKKGFKTLEEHGFAIYCRETQWVCIVKFMEWNPAENPNQRKAFDKALAAMPETCFAEGLRNGLVTVTEQAVGIGVAVGTGVEAPPKGDSTFSRWTKSLNGEKAIPADHAVFGYAEKVGIPADFLPLAWAWFEKTYGSGGTRAKKRYTDWPGVFRNAVEGNWAKAWYAEPDGSYKLSTVGLQLQREIAP